MNTIPDLLREWKLLTARIREMGSAALLDRVTLAKACKEIYIIKQRLDKLETPSPHRNEGRVKALKD